jgi:PAS domain S-box-containing protein
VTPRGTAGTMTSEPVPRPEVADDARLQLALEAGRMGTWDWNLATDRVTWSPGLEAIHGLAPGTLQGGFADYRSVIHPEDRERVMRAITRTLEAGEDHRVEYRVVRPDGDMAWIEARGKLFRDEHGAPTRMIGVCIDVTERRWAELQLRRNEEALRASEARLRDETQALARLTKASSRLWRARRLSKGLDEMLAATIELMGADMGHVQLLDPARNVLVVAAQRGFAPELVEQFREMTPTQDWASSRALRTRERIIVEDIETDAPYASYRALARAAGYRAVQSTPLVGREGNALGMLSTHFRRPYRPSDADLRRLDLYIRQAADFIERCRMEEALRDSEQRFSRFMQHFPGLAWIKDLDGRYVYANEAAQRVFGTPDGGLFGRFDTAIFPSDTAALFRDNDRLALESDTGIQTVETLRHADGTVHSSLVAKFPIPAPDGQIAFVGGMAIDVTDRIAAEERIAALNDDLRRRLEEQETLLRSLPVGVFIAHGPDCSEMTMNPAGAEMLRMPLGTNPSMSGPDAKSLGFRVFADGVELPAGELPMQIAAREGRPITGIEVDIVFDDGGVRTLYEYAAPLFDGSGRVRGCLGVFVDITDRKQAEQRQRLLVEELNHRVKNTLAIVQSIAALTLRETPDPVAFRVAFSARVAALARAHGILTRELWQGALLRDVVTAALAPFSGSREKAVTMDGPRVLVRPDAAVTLSLVLHELATNAMKHGALSAARGRVTLEWSSTRDLVTLCWQERGGPRVVPPTRKGFGSRLITASAQQLGGGVTLGFPPDGFEAEFRFPLDAGRA